jgi:hypothetical protein
VSAETAPTLFLVGPDRERAFPPQSNDVRIWHSPDNSADKTNIRPFRFLVLSQAIWYNLLAKVFTNRPRCAFACSSAVPTLRADGDPV